MEEQMTVAEVNEYAKNTLKLNRKTRRAVRSRARKDARKANK